MKRAAIYTRVSTEAQGEKASPKEQEKDCLNLAKGKGYDVVEIYRDIGSATSLKNRPEFRKMLRDGTNKKFDVLIAWREDRLYRGYMDTGFIDLMRLIDSEKIEIDLVTEHFDKTMAVIKAAMAAQENQARVVRSHMGAKARLREGKSWGTEQFFGYTKEENDRIIIDQAEAKVVAMIWDWYEEGVGVREISRKLIEKQIPQKRRKKVDARSWKVGSIYKILKHSEYATGIHVVKRDGETFSISVPKIREVFQYARIQEKLKRNYNNKARNVKNNYLVRGLVTSTCNGSWGAITRKMKKTWHKKSTGEGFDYFNEYSYYYCRRRSQSVSNEAHEEGCPVTKSARMIDNYVWDQVSRILRNPNLLREAAESEIKRLQERNKKANEEYKKLNIKLEEQERIKATHIDYYGRLGATGVFTEDDLKKALLRVQDEQSQIRSKMVELELAASAANNDIGEIIENQILELSAGTDWLEEEFEDKDIKQRQFDERRKIVEKLVDTVKISKNQYPQIIFKINLEKIFNSNYYDTQGGQYRPA